MQGTQRFIDIGAVEAWDAWFRWRQDGELRDVSIEQTWSRVAGALAGPELPGQAAPFQRQLVDALLGWKLLPDERIAASAGTAAPAWPDDGLVAVLNAANFVRRRFDAIGARAEIDTIEIKLENFVLGVFALEPQREFSFLEFALKRALLREEQVFRELLCQRRAALRPAAMQQVGKCRARDACGIDAEMRIEPPVLDGDERLGQIGRQVLQRDVGAGHLAACRDHAAVGADDLDGRRPLGNFQRLNRRQMRADPDDDATGGDHRPQAKDRAPIEQTANPAPGSSTRRLLVALGLRTALARWAFARLVIVHGGARIVTLRLVIAGLADAIPRIEAQAVER